MAITLRWRNRVVADEIRIYRSESTMDPNLLPAAYDTVSAAMFEYEDVAVVAGTTYFYRVGAALTSASPDRIAVSDEVEIVAAAVESGSVSPSSVVSVPTFSYTGAVVRLTASDDVEAQALPWDAVTEHGATGFWNISNPTRLVVPTGVSLVQINAQLRFDGGGTFSGTVFAAIVGSPSPNPQPTSSHRRQSSGSVASQMLYVKSGPIAVSPGGYFELFWNCSNASNAVLLVDGTWMEMEVLA